MRAQKKLKREAKESEVHSLCRHRLSRRLTPTSAKK